MGDQLAAASDSTGERGEGGIDGRMCGVGREALELGPRL